jgi:hypothetical protein
MWISFPVFFSKIVENYSAQSRAPTRRKLTCVRFVPKAESNPTSFFFVPSA